MAVKLIDESILGDIADAIRGRSGFSDKISPQNMDDAVHGLYGAIDQNTDIGGVIIKSSDNIYDVNFDNNNLDMFPVISNKVLSICYNNCQNLRGYPICGNNVVNMHNAYSHCHWLNGNPVCGPNVTDMSNAYSLCPSLTGEPVCGPNVVNMSYAYYTSNNLRGKPICGEKVIDMSYAYAVCSSLRSNQPVCGPNVVNMSGAYYMTYRFPISETIKIQPVCGPNVVNMSNAYGLCEAMTGFPVCGPNVVNMCRAYDCCTNLTGVPVCGPNVSNMFSAYNACRNLRGFAICGPNVKYMYSAYSGCRNISGISIYGKYLEAPDRYSNCENVKNIFIDLYELKNLNMTVVGSTWLGLNRSNWNDLHIYVNATENGDINIANYGNLVTNLMQYPVKFRKVDDFSGTPSVVVPRMLEDGTIINCNYSLRWDDESWDIVANKETIRSKGYYWEMYRESNQAVFNNSYMVIVTNNKVV